MPTNLPLTADNVLKSAAFDCAATDIAQIGRFFARQGWSPATSSNYSILLAPDLIAISRTGVDKFEMAPSDVICINQNAQVIAPMGAKSSAETLIHTAIYERRPGTNSVLHTHSPAGTRLSLKYLDQGCLKFHGYEIQKGLKGATTHDGTVVIPILPNAQNMVDFSKKVRSLLVQHSDIHGFLIAGHGLYTWGKDLAEAKRHVETLEFLFQCQVLELSGA